MKLYMFRTVPLSIIRRFFTVHNAMVYTIAVCVEFFTVHTAMVYIIAVWSFSLCTQQWYISNGIDHCCVHSKKLLMMDRGTVRNM